ncbi:nuclear transport factor 2 family protein [Spirosoma arcticum]
MNRSIIVLFVGLPLTTLWAQPIAASSQTNGVLTMYHPNPDAAPDQRERNRKVVDNFFVALETYNFDLLNEVFAQNGRQFNPYVPEGFPKSFDGRAAIHKQYSSLPERFASMKFSRTIYATEDPNFFFAQWRGVIVIKTGGTYENDYIGTFRLKDGLVTEYTEYFNPIVMAKAFGISLSEK